MSYSMPEKDLKLVQAREFAHIRQALADAGRTVVQCHGVFDLLHPGHITHLQQAKSQGDVLVVTVTADAYVNKGPGRPYFNEALRMSSLAALDCVDYVLLSQAKTAVEAIALVRPQLYVKGQEYADAQQDVTGKIDAEIEQVEALGGRAFFTEGEVFSSSWLLNNAFPTVSPEIKEYLKGFAGRYPFSVLRESLEKKRRMKVLVVGDIIIDEYIFCNVQGLISKAHGLSVRYLKEERYLGGALAVARHLSSFSDQVTVCGIVGKEAHIHTQLLADMSSNMRLDLQFAEDYKTVVKRRFVQRSGLREDYDKLFSISYFADDNNNGASMRQAFNEKLKLLSKENDLIVVVDYGHGLIDKAAMEILQTKGNFLAVNCQTNSSNYGTNLITKYQRADAFALDQTEIKLAFADRISSEPELLTRLVRQLKSTQGWLTQGSQIGRASCRERVFLTV